ncbi:MAG: hypothetical protein JXQ71_00425 [Verrucomicrobia bacterium]|nr:hypothetical protein [Verrucomicrobiota bacterium]
MKPSFPLFWALLILTLVGLAGAGCKSADSENISSRPWNAPRGFDTGLPGFDAPR